MRIRALVRRHGNDTKQQKEKMTKKKKNKNKDLLF